MKKTLSIFGLTLAFLALLDVAVAGVLSWADDRGKIGSLVQYFDYGRSVPGKLQKWRETPNTDGNLYDVAWLDDAVAISQTKFNAAERADGPIVRSYGMSFVNNILQQAAALNPALLVDYHAGPAAPPNFTYALFLDDAANRHPGDVVVLGILSSSVPALAALSNRTWNFEQPAPYTYPVFLPDKDALSRTDPIVKSVQDQRALQNDPQTDAAWAEQLADQDLFYARTTFGAIWLDRSPFARLVRRSLAKGHVERTEAKILSGAFPYADVLTRIISGFAETARAEGQIPVVMLIQTRAQSDVDLLAIAQPVLERGSIPYLATAEHFDPRDVSGFLADGHYQPEIDKRLGQAFLKIVAAAQAAK